MQARLDRVEELLMHAQATVQALDEALIGQQKRIDALEREMRRIRAEMGTLREASADITPSLPRPEDEVPPHY